uniref:Uncharacterized protein n=1 Tax=Chrysemys picta bellii TaxID=8478 RepID=A0A8C3H7A4_CHRPI
MEVRSSFDKFSQSSESVSTLNSEEFVLVHQQPEDPHAKDEKPQLKVHLLCFCLCFKCIVRISCPKRL